MRLLLLNPNMTETMTQQMLESAQNVVSTGVELLPATATRGFPYISSRAEAQISGAIALEMIAEQHAVIDGVVIAAFGDPGLKAARELFSFPVVGMAEAAISVSALLGERFSIVTFSPIMSRWYMDSIEASGQLHRCTGVRTPTAGKLGVDTEKALVREEIARLANLSASEDGADVVILGGAPLAGMAADIQAQTTALVIDPIAAAVSTLETLVNVTSATGYNNRHARPAPKSSVNLPEALSNVIARSDGQ